MRPAVPLRIPGNAFRSLQCARNVPGTYGVRLRWTTMAEMSGAPTDDVIVYGREDEHLER